jgi:hypothetical protein
MAQYKITGGDNRVYGPANEDELRHWIAEGRLNGQSLVQAEGSTEWRPLASFPEFAQALGAPPGAPPPLAPAPGVPLNPEVLAVEILANRPTLHIGSCMSRSWHLLLANFGVIFGATALVWLIATVCERLPLVQYAYWLISGPLYGGLFLVLLHRMRNQPAKVGEVFDGFRLDFVQLMLVGLVSTLLQKIGFCLCILPGIYLLVAWQFGIPLVADKKLEFWSALELSRKVATRVWFQVLALLIVTLLPFLLINLFASVKVGVAMSSALQGVFSAGAPDPMTLWPRLLETMGQVLKANLLLLALTKIVLLLNLPWALGALMYAYEDLFGPRQAPGA